MPPCSTSKGSYPRQFWIMRSLAVIATALALWTQPASATTFGVSFGGSGVGTDRHAADYGYPPVIYTDTSGYFSFNLAFATPFGDGLLVKDRPRRRPTRDQYLGLAKR